MAETRFLPVDRHLTSKSSQASENSPVPIFAVIILGLVAIGTMWFLARGPVRVSRPRLRIETGKVIVTSDAVNRTSQPVRLSLQLVVGFGSPSTKGHRGGFHEIAQREMEVTLGPKSSQTIEWELSVPDLKRYGNLEAMVQVLHRE